MSSISIPYLWIPLNIDYWCKNWDYTPYVNTAFMPGADHRVVKMLSNAINRCGYQMPQVTFSQAWSQFNEIPDYAYSCDPYLDWYQYDGGFNYRNMEVHVLTAPRIDGSGYSQFYICSDVDDFYCSGDNTLYSEFYDFDKTHVFGNELERTTAAGGMYEYHMSLLNGFSMQEVIVQAKPLYDAVQGVNPALNPGAVSEGGVIDSAPIYAMTKFLHTIRTQQCATAFNWVAIKEEGAYDETFTTDSIRGIYTNSATYVNALDSTWTSRNEQSPGFPCSGYMRGRGDQAETYGQTIKIWCYVRALASTSDATVKFEGPNDSCEVTVIAGQNTLFGDGSTNYVTLSTTVTDANETSSRNKIDVFIKAGASGELRVYGLFGLRYGAD